MLRDLSCMMIFCLLASCSKSTKSSTPGSFNGIEVVDFCDLPKNEGKLVRVQAIYSGVEEYWGLKSTHHCDSSISLELDDLAGKPIPRKFKRKFEYVHASYWTCYLIVEVTGIYESKSQGGYGHLGSNTARLIIKDYLSVTMINKPKPKG